MARRGPARHRIHLNDLPPGDLGVDITVGLMIGFIREGANDPVVRDAIGTLDRSNQEQAVRSAFDLVLAKVRYELDPDDEELVRAAWVTLNRGMAVGDCDCMTVALGSMCAGMNIPCWVKVIDWRDDVDEFTHVYLLAEVRRGVAIPLDPVMGRVGFGGERWPLKRHKEYKV